MRSKLPFVVIPEDVRVWETYPESLEFYSADSVKRMGALKPGLDEAVGELNRK